MSTIEIPTDDPVKMVRAIRDKRYEETKNMTPEEKNEYHRKKLEEFEEFRKRVNPNDYDFPFLRGEKKKEPTE